jgi:Mrp family chromosome partitioning ATPase
VSSTPAWPKKVPTVLVAALAMFALSSGFVLTGELLSGGAPSRPARRVPLPETAEPVLERGTANSRSKASFEASPKAQAADLPPKVEVKPPLGVPLEAVENLARELAGAAPSERRIAVLGARPNIGTTMAAITLARSLARQNRVALIDLALEKPNLTVIASDPAAPGMADLVRGTASFGQIITRDRFSRVHLITAGTESDAAAILGSQRLAITLEALARSYDYVVVDAGALPAAPVARFAQLAPRGVLVVEEANDKEARAGRDKLIKAGFANVTVLASEPRGPELGTGGSRAAA